MTDADEDSLLYVLGARLLGLPFDVRDKICDGIVTDLKELGWGTLPAPFSERALIEIEARWNQRNHAKARFGYSDVDEANNDIGSLIAAIRARNSVGEIS
jgi:hypothetical protein